MVENLVFHARTKHIEVHHHYIREKVFEGEIEMVPTKTKEQIADILTKSLHKAKFEKFRKARLPREKFALRGSVGMQGNLLSIFHHARRYFLWRTLELVI